MKPVATNGSGTGALDPARHAAVGSLVTAVNDFGLAVTSAVVAADLGAISSNSDIIVLSAIRRDGPQRPNVLTKLTHLTTGGTTNLLDRLESAALIARSSEGLDDGRGVLVSLTDVGNRAIERLAGVFAGLVASEPHLGDEMRAQFAVLGFDVPALPSSLTEVDAQLGDLIRLARFGQQVAELLGAVVDDPTPTKSMLTLWHGSRPGGVRPGQLSEITGLSSAGVSELLERLEQRDVIERAAGRPPDRRVVVVTTTEVGQRELAVAFAQIADHLDELHAQLVDR